MEDELNTIFKARHCQPNVKSFKTAKLKYSVYVQDET